MKNFLSKALEKDYAGKVKCIYIDPPYNTGSAFDHYDDGLEHSVWLGLIRDRLEMLHKLLSSDGVILIQIDDHEYPYLKVLCDEVFGRKNFETTFFVKVRHENRMLREDIRYQLVMEQVLIYSKSDEFIAPRRLKPEKKVNDYRYDVELLSSADRVVQIGGYEVEVYPSSAYRIIESEYGSLKNYQIRGSLITQNGSASEFYEKNI